jgi:hypothetical protein
MPRQKEPAAAPKVNAESQTDRTASWSAGCSGLIARWTDEVASLADAIDPSHSTCFVLKNICS